MADIVLATLNAKYLHTSFGLRYLHANLGELRSKACILEFDINQRPLDIVETLVAAKPTIVGLGVYIWNARETLEVVRLLKKLLPECTIILGGPEVSHELEGQALVELASYVITGEADHAFRELCTSVLTGAAPEQKVHHAPPPDVTTLQFPYELYSEDDIAHRLIYVEASRGCPFTCEFCLSSLEVPVRQFEVDGFLSQMQRLLDRGVQHFKFVDRTFNLNPRTSVAILSFFLERLRPGLFVHFEMVPDRLPEALRALIRKFPAGSLQFEVGIQTFNPEVAKLISRRQDYEKLRDNICFLRRETSVHIHADLIAGLPGEGLESFGEGFNRLLALDPQEIQVGILKRLRGTPIIRHTAEYEMCFSDSPPYEVLHTKHLSFPEMQRLRRFAKLWDQIGNSGNFVNTTRLLWNWSRSTETEKAPAQADPFHAVLALSDWLHEQGIARNGMALKRLAEVLHKYLRQITQVQERTVLQALSDDFHRLGRFDKPAFLSEFESEQGLDRNRRPAPNPKHSAARQARHLGTAPS